MASTLPFATPGLSALDLVNLNPPAAGKLSAAGQAKAHAAAQDFEAVFLNSMFQHMFTDIDGESPSGGQGATGVWRSVLTTNMPSRSPRPAASALPTRSIAA